VEEDLSELSSPYVSEEVRTAVAVSRQKEGLAVRPGEVRGKANPVGTTLPSHVIAAVLEGRAKRLPAELIRKEVLKRGMLPISIDTIKNICTFPQLYKPYAGYREKSRPNRRNLGQTRKRV
jgi:hypothetical protein